MINQQQSKKLSAENFAYSVELTFVLLKLLMAFCDHSRPDKIEGENGKKILKPRDLMHKSHDPVEVVFTFTSILYVPWIVRLKTR